MSEAALKRILFLVGALVLVYGAVRVGAYAMRPRGDSGGALAATFDRLRKDSLASVTVVSPKGDTVQARRAADGWTVNGFRADSIAADRLVRAVREASVSDLVAQSAETHARLGVTSDSAWTATLRTERDSATLLIGNTGPEYGTTYVRLPNADAVYEVRGELRGALAIPLGDWRDKTIVRTDTTAVHALVVERDRKSARLERADKSWKRVSGPAKATVDTARVRDVLSELARFEATGFPADTATFTGKETRRLVALDAKGDTLAAIELTGDDTAWLARSRGSTQIYQVASYRVDRLVPKVDSLFK